MRPFLEALDERVLVCDGAMGTLLYAQGVFVNRSFDSLNLSDPSRVRAVHEAYVRAGADVLETNTFGANRVKLRAFGLGNSLRDINLQGARLARDAAGSSAYVAGAVGPLGLRIEPWGRTPREKALEYFREQAEALVEGGVDLFILETFRDVNEICAAVAAVRSVCSLPIVAQMTVEDDGNSLDGTPPEQFAPALRESGADVVGLNCSIGPAHMLEALERMSAVTGSHLSAQPNAGQPRELDGRTIYLTSPEYMASYARRFVERRVRLVGGCCGTTPAHVEQIRSAMSRVSPRVFTGSAGPPTDRRAAPAGESTPRETVQPRAEKSDLSRALADRRWVTLVEVIPPKGHDADAAIEQARVLRERGVNAVLVADGPSGPRLSGLSLAALIARHARIDVVLQYSSRDKHLLGMQSELLGAYAMGLRNVVVVTGDPQPVGDYADATAVIDVDSVGLVNAVSRLNRGLDVGGQAIGRPTAFFLGVAVNPGADDLDGELRRFDHKVEAGAEYVICRPVFDVKTFERAHRRLEASGLPIVLSLRPFASVLDAEYLANEVPGVRVPQDVIERMRRASGEDAAAAEGVAIAGEVGRALKSLVGGVSISSPSVRFDLGLALLQRLH
ncbi:MAG TPA: bifunctional homocysteine S-methyltransferase/methylenetetrahydrofolate reductase [Vicinamibacterales bacterium]|nr:bifunctional homocysteine S-methyltransferase/methylenetetrahydrofolate reductase [Vicinamibacterales bacterium]